MNTNTYDQFIQITQVDNSAVKSIFMHLNSVTSKINLLKFNRIVLSLKNNSEYTLIYELDKDTKIPMSVYTTLSMLFNNTSYLTDDIIINVDVTYDDKNYSIHYENSELQCPVALHFLFSDNKYFNFFTDLHNANSNVELFERLFEFMIKKELPTTAEGIFKIQFDKYYAGSQQDNGIENIVKQADTEILIEKLLKTKNEIFSKINTLTHSSTTLTEEKEKLLDYAQNKEKYTLSALLFLILRTSDGVNKEKLPFSPTE